MVTRICEGSGVRFTDRIIFLDKVDPSKPWILKILKQTLELLVKIPVKLYFEQRLSEATRWPHPSPLESYLFSLAYPVAIL